MSKLGYYDIAIIGGGASGLAASIAAAGAHPGASVALLDRNLSAGRKINATGNGRCNYLNRNASADTYYSNSGPEAASAVLSAVFNAHPVGDLLNFFEKLGIIPAEEDEGRLYPRSFQAKSISAALIRAAEEAGVKIITGFSASVCNRTDSGFVIHSDTSQIIECGKLIIATGGKAGMQYGCFGDGYRFAKAFGHTVIKPIPALTQLTVREDISALAGVRAKARIGLYEQSVQTYRVPDDFTPYAAPEKIKMQAPKTYEERTLRALAEDSGELQFTKETLSGICTFNVSRFLRRVPGCEYEAHVDLFEEYSEEALKDLFSARFKEFGTLSGVLFGLLPDKLCSWLLEGFDGSPEALAAKCRDLVFSIDGTRSWNDAQVTSGGVALSEVDPETLQSRLVPGLAFCGEVLDADAVCGGYNLAFAFASGLLAGEKI
ncbi:MAG: NAD(P)/FAD-dependent oxidoreductase [Firmicutes bacterium]|nr:NAD(P)/FAD-dependent oxidoreductase [Bacillota bacterium]